MSYNFIIIVIPSQDRICSPRKEHYLNPKLESAAKLLLQLERARACYMINYIKISWYLNWNQILFCFFLFSFFLIWIDNKEEDQAMLLWKQCPYKWILKTDLRHVQRSLCSDTIFSHCAYNRNQSYWLLITGAFGLWGRKTGSLKTTFKFLVHIQGKMILSYCVSIQVEQ